MHHDLWVWAAILAFAILAMVPMAGAQQEDQAATLRSDELEARGGVLCAAIHGRIVELVADSPHDLFTRHLRSIDALVQAEWARCMVLLPTRPDAVAQTIGFLETVRDGLDGDAGKWESYASGRRAMVMAYVSDVDRTLHPYHLRLPRGWEPDRAYPAIVYLHGHVPDEIAHPMWYVSVPLRADGAEPDKATEAVEPHVWIAPWGRCNGGYRDSAETDVWEAIADAKRLVRVDEDRQYLTGHSMGGAGTWSIATRTPDRWAGIAIYAGAARDADPDIAGNLANMPVLIWHGAKERPDRRANSDAMREALKRFGNDANWFVNENAGHMVPAGEKTPHDAWLLEHTRERPDRFQFVADTARHTSVWGIRTARPRPGQPFPRFSCRIEDGVVAIDSENTDGLEVQFGKEGLGLTGTVTLIWNGEKAYEGPVTDEPVQLGSGAGGRRW